MTVRELIALLTDCDPEANVTYISQPGYPFEWSIQGIAIRQDFENRHDHEHDGDDDGLNEGLFDDDSDDYGTHALDTWNVTPKRGNDVVLVEGSQLSYASRDAWDAVIRP